MDYPYIKLNVDNPEKYYYANHDIWEAWKNHRSIVNISIRKKIDVLVKEFETTKNYRNVDLINIAKIFCTAYDNFGNLTYLNSFLKCIDIMCSIIGDMDILDRTKLYKLIEKEKKFILKIKENL